MGITSKILLGKIKEYNEAYRKGAPIVSDKEYDSIVEKLRTIDPDNEWFKHPEPATVAISNRKTPLPIPMKSLDKCKNIAEVLQWAKSAGLKKDSVLVCTPKFDGLSLLMDERTGQSYSRGGNDNEGQDCTQHTTRIKKDGNYHYTFGEFVISRKSWDENFNGKLSPYTGEKYKSPRNTAAGLLNRATPSDELRHISFFRYGTDDKSRRIMYDQYINMYTDLCKTYKQEPLYLKTTLAELTEKLLKDKFSEWSKIYPIDGIVIYINDLYKWDILGRKTTTGNPMYAIAYKHPDFTDSFETTVKGVNWKISKSGALKPVVAIDPVDTGDCNMENPTGYNARWIYEHNIANLAKVLVTRSGGVIPKILATIQEAPQLEKDLLWDRLEKCPVCGEQTVWDDNKVDVMCKNPECPGRKLAKIVFFYNVCEAENTGEETITKIYNAGFTSVSAVLNITPEELMGIDGFAEGISTFVLNNNKRIMQGLDMATLMQASDCFAGIGKVKAQKILDDMAPQDLAALYNKKLRMPKAKINTQPITMQNFYNGLDAFYLFLRETEIPILPYETTPQEHNGKCEEMVVCMSGFRDSDLEKSITRSGGRTTTSVSKATTLLVVQDTAATSQKISKALAIGVPIISRQDFINTYLN